MRKDFDKDFIFPPTCPHKVYTSVEPVKDYQILIVLLSHAVIAFLYFY